MSQPSPSHIRATAVRVATLRRLALSVLFTIATTSYQTTCTVSERTFNKRQHANARYAVESHSSITHYDNYNCHLQSHLEGWYWCNTCTYKNKDKRNRDSHMRIHQQQGIGLECYVCKQCGKAMRFNTQLRRHKQSGCQIIDLSVQKDTAKQSKVKNDE